MFSIRLVLLFRQGSYADNTNMVLEVIVVCDSHSSPVTIWIGGLNVPIHEVKEAK